MRRRNMLKGGLVAGILGVLGRGQSQASNEKSRDLHVDTLKKLTVDDLKKVCWDYILCSNYCVLGTFNGKLIYPYMFEARVGTLPSQLITKCNLSTGLVQIWTPETWTTETWTALHEDMNMEEYLEFLKKVRPLRINGEIVTQTFTDVFPMSVDVYDAQGNLLVTLTREE